MEKHGRLRYPARNNNKKNLPGVVSRKPYFGKHFMQDERQVH